MTTAETEKNQVCTTCGESYRRSGITQHRKHCRGAETLSPERNKQLLGRLWGGFAFLVVLTLYNSVEALAGTVRGIAVSASQTLGEKMMETKFPHLLSAGYFSLGGAILPEGLGVGPTMAHLQSQALCQSGWSKSNETCQLTQKEPSDIQVYWKKDVKDAPFCTGLKSSTVEWKECQNVCREKGLLCHICKGVDGAEKCIGRAPESTKLVEVTK
jgi:hypothetical protein